MLRSAIVTAAVSFGLASAAFAQDDEPPANSLRWFESFDLNKDGFITPAEMETAGAAEFARIDKDKSGTITIDEYLADSPDATDDEVRRMKNRFAVMDRRGDGNGVVSQAEFINFGKFVIEIADADHDGRMSREEFVESVTPAKPAQ
jgi:Ca2+-binding EF-hand superfamily protein